MGYKLQSLTSFLLCQSHKSSDLHHALEGIPELMGNHAGWEAGGILADYTRGKLSQFEAREQLRKELCK